MNVLRVFETDGRFVWRERLVGTQGEAAFSAVNRYLLLVDRVVEDDDFVADSGGVDR
jgi:hypothetical protein